MQLPPDLSSLRESIEALDRRILEALQERMQLAELVAAAKLGSAYPLRDQEREDFLLRRIRHAATEIGLDPHEVERLYRGILSMSVSRQEAHIQGLPTTPVRVAYQGVEGSYSHLAAQRRFAGSEGGVLLTGFDTFREAVEAVAQGDADVALLPIENTTAGSINETYDLLAEGRVVVVGEVVSSIEHCLLALPGTKLEQLRTVISHPQALAQCGEFLASLPGVLVRADFDTAGSARRVRDDGDRTVAAIASESAAGRYGLAILRRGIQTRTGNFTRFVEVRGEALPCPADVPCKTSLMLDLTHRPGALGDILQEFSRRGLSLTKLESRPHPETAWRYRFYLDVEVHAASEPATEAFEAIGPLTTELRILGTYPAALRPGVDGAEQTPGQK